MRPSAFLVAVSFAALALVQVPGCATCPDPVPFDQAVRRADMVWWATVTRAHVVPNPKLGGPLGVFDLTMRVRDVLKGPPPETPGLSPPPDTGIVFTSPCGPLPSSKELQATAEAMVGTTRLFIGQDRGGALIEHFGPITADGMTQKEQHQRAKALLAHRAASTVAPPGGGWGVWTWALIVVAAVLAVLVGWFTFLNLLGWNS
jgi:hypothetical protein